MNTKLDPLLCGENECERMNRCCRQDDTCGMKVPTQIFKESCVLGGARPGMLADACPPSPEYCEGNRCQTFAGCMGADGCRYWVERVEIVGSEEIMEGSVDLGCVNSNELVAP